MRAYVELAVMYKGDNVFFFTSLGTRVSKPFEPWISYCELGGINSGACIYYYGVIGLHTGLMPGYCIVDLKKLTMWLLSRVNSLMPAIIIVVSLD